MSVSRKMPNSFNEEHLRILHFLADHAAIAIENARLHNLIQQQALTDPLTNIPNRRALNNHLDLEIRRARRYQHDFTVLMIDLNGFKRINDRFGHPQGDRVLQHAARCLQDSIRDTDFIARFGGDEFAVILPETSVSSAQVVSEKLARVLASSPIELSNEEQVSLTLSIGIATYPQDGNTPDELISAADQAMYTAKEGNILYTTYS
jgi:diguanylate cyclase (GGDEF)-like protein